MFGDSTSTPDDAVEDDGLARVALRALPTRGDTPMKPAATRDRLDPERVRPQ
jgi:hypothetical protein